MSVDDWKPGDLAWEDIGNGPYAVQVVTTPPDRAAVGTVWTVTLATGRHGWVWPRRLTRPTPQELAEIRLAHLAGGGL